MLCWSVRHLRVTLSLRGNVSANPSDQEGQRDLADPVNQCPAVVFVSSAMIGAFTELATDNPIASSVRLAMTAPTTRVLGWQRGRRGHRWLPSR